MISSTRDVSRASSKPAATLIHDTHGTPIFSQFEAQIILATSPSARGQTFDYRLQGIRKPPDKDPAKLSCQASLMLICYL